MRRSTPYRLAINGYGRIGQSVLRALYVRGLQHRIQVIAINELADIETLTYLTRYDTTHGRFPLAVKHDQQALYIDQDRIDILQQSDPVDIPWKGLDIDMVLECTGRHSQREEAQKHLDQGAKRVLFSNPASADIDATIIFGVNEEQLQAHHRIASAASCTTNCLVPVLHLLDQAFGIDYGVTTTLHSAMNDQPVIDSYHHTDLRLTRSALQSIIPVDTGLSKGIDRLMPHLAGKFECLHMRVPTLNVSVMDLSLHLKCSVDVESVNACMQYHAREGRLKDLLGYTNEPHASVDFNGDARSVIIDATQTRVSSGKLLKMICWFDNEWGYANRMLDVAMHWLDLPSQTVSTNV